MIFLDISINIIKNKYIYIYIFKKKKFFISKLNLKEIKFFKNININKKIFNFINPIFITIKSKNFKIIKKKYIYRYFLFKSYYSYFLNKKNLFINIHKNKLILNSKIKFIKKLKKDKDIFISNLRKLKK